MIALLKNDIDNQRTTNWGFADHCVVLVDKFANDAHICIVQSVRMSYFTPTGKARMRPVYSYSIYKKEDGVVTWVRSFKNKSDAKKFFKTFK
jgi:hypothetical protein